MLITHTKTRPDQSQPATQPPLSALQTMQRLRLVLGKVQTKHIAAAAMIAVAGQAYAFCPVPTTTGNPAYDQFAQQQFYVCLQQQQQQQQMQAAQQPAYRPQGGQMDFSLVAPSIRIGAAQQMRR